ncbi:MAG: glycoside hydrolase family 25 protein [Lachnospiraceae bacterium]|nr:glycoside hydrolase family 25 protein [Lachnospiraceae bacterium]
MKLTGGDNKISPQLGAVAIGTAIVLIVILAIAIVPAVKKNNHHTDFSKLNRETAQAGTEAEEEYVSPVIEENKYDTPEITSPDELDFWDLYPKDDPEEGVSGQAGKEGGLNGGGTGNGAGTGAGAPGGGNAAGTGAQGTGAGAGESPETDENDPSKDGKHTKVILRDGTEEWVTISQYLPKNDYDYTNLVSKNDRMEYYIDGKKVSYLGVDISKYQDYIDFNKVKKNGIDFVMIRLGARGYGTGQITIDDYFFDNLKRATDAGLKVGVYFSSQAINTDEAIEEAETVIDSIGEYRLDYPIAFDMGFVDNDTARIEGLSNNERTEIAKTFLDYVSGEGYTGCIYGTKEWFIKEIEMSKLTAYDFWLAQEEDLPDYPYKFSIWQYSRKGTVDGISGYVNLNISFVDYTEK